MGLFGSLYTSSSGMAAASVGTQNVSENVANMSTIGYKRSDTAFADILGSTKSDGGVGSSGAVAATKITRAGQQGQIQQTGSSLDASIIGKGFFPVSRDLIGESFAYTRNGQFSEFAVRATADAQALVTENTGEQAFLRNSAGFYLYGWPVDIDGNVTSGTDTSSLQPIEVGSIQSQALATTTMNIGVNLDASEADYNPQVLGQTLPVSNQGLHFNRSITVYDSTGGEHPVTFQYRKISGPMAQFTSNRGIELTPTDALVDPAGNTPGILNGDTLTISDGTETLTVNFVTAPADPLANEASTITEMNNLINSFTGTGTTQLFNASLTSSGEFIVRSINPSSSLDISASSASVLGNTGFDIPTDPVDGDYVYDPDQDISAAATATDIYPDQDSFPALSNTTDPNVHGWWEVTVLIPDPADPTGGNSVIQTQGLLNFDGSGGLNAASGAETLDLGIVDFDSGGTGDEVTLTVNMDRMTQFSGNYDVLQADQNGAPVGERTGIYISEGGFVKAQFSNGVEINIYQIPLATFANPEGLNAISGTAFTESAASGGVTLGAAETNGAGSINGSTLENSNVDLGSEMSYLIIYQRTFGLNSQVINAIDEMTQNLSQLKR